MSDREARLQLQSVFNELNEVRELLAECQHGNDKLREEAAAYRKRANRLVKRVQELERQAEALAMALKTFTRHPYLFGGSGDCWYCKFCQSQATNAWKIKHADTCPVGQGLAALEELEATDE